MIRFIRIKRSFLSLILLLIIGILFRVVPIWNGGFSFMYDNAKDQLEIMEMGINHRPALTGAVTSIPGVFNGPLWYYIALPANLLSHYHPFASVITVVIMALVSIFMLYRFSGWFEALLYTTSIGIIGAQQSAWTPYMTPFITLPIILLLLSVNKRVGLNRWKLRIIFFLTGLSFHFQTAFGMVLLPVVLLILILLRQIKLKHIFDIFLSFCLPFLPFLAFELRHNFHQTKEIINFVMHYQEQAAIVQPNASGFYRFVEIGNYMLKTMVASIVPIEISPLLTMVIGFSIIGLCIRYLLSIKEKNERVIFLVLITGTYCLYLFFPAKSYYFIALMPIWIIFFSKAVTVQFSKSWLVIFSILLIFLGTIRMLQNYHDYRLALENNAFPYAPKLEAVLTVYKLSQGRPFASYQFVPEIYDYTYQQIYLFLIQRGFLQPTEFSYAPGEITYISQKHLPKSEIKPENIFLIVEKGTNEDVYRQWQRRITSNLSIIAEYPINNAITVYQAVGNE